MYKPAGARRFNSPIYCPLGANDSSSMGIARWIFVITIYFADADQLVLPMADLVKGTPLPSEPLVSVIIPTYNRRQIVLDAIKSVIRQTYDEIELIVVDDGSSQKPELSMSELDEKEMVEYEYIQHEQNKGANAARNTGIQAASGDLVAFLDDDDYWEDEKIKRQVDVFQEANQDVGVVYTGQRFVNETGKTTSLRISTTEGKITKDLIRGEPVNPFSTIMVRPEIIDKAGLPDERFPSWQDREWYFRLSRFSKFKPIPEPLMVRRFLPHPQIIDNFEATRDITYPLFIEKHRPLAAEYGSKYEKKFVASLSCTLAGIALANGYYSDCRKYGLKTVKNDYAQRQAYLYIGLSLGGKYTYKPAQLARRFVHRQKTG